MNGLRGLQRLVPRLLCGKTDPPALLKASECGSLHDTITFSEGLLPYTAAGCEPSNALYIFDVNPCQQYDYVTGVYSINKTRAFSLESKPIVIGRVESVLSEARLGSKMKTILSVCSRPSRAERT